MRSGDGSRLDPIKCSRQSRWITETDCSSSTEVSGNRHDHRSIRWPSSCRLVSKVDPWPMKLLRIYHRWQQVSDLNQRTLIRTSERENSADHCCRRLAYLSLSLPSATKYSTSTSTTKSIWFVFHRSRSRTGFLAWRILSDERYSCSLSIHSWSFISPSKWIAQQSDSDPHRRTRDEPSFSAGQCVDLVVHHIQWSESRSVVSLSSLAAMFRSKMILWNVFWLFKCSMKTTKHFFLFSTLCYQRTIWTFTPNCSPKCSHWKRRNASWRKGSQLVRVSTELLFSFR